MARTVRSAQLENRTQRLKLLYARRHWKPIGEGVALGYRRTKTGFGTWSVRVLADRAAGRYELKRIGRADDTEDADGHHVLTYFQAADRARALIGNSRAKASGKLSAPLTVEQAVKDYLEWFRAQRKSYGATKATFDAHILPRFGRELVADLTAREIQRWHQKLAATPARARSRKGVATPRHQAQDLTDPDVARGRKASANRILTVFRAALNHAWRDGLVASDSEWRRVKPFRDVDEPRVRYLEHDQVTRLINASPADLRRLSMGALLTGCRLGELTKMLVGDYHADAASAHVRDSKSGKSRYVPLTAEGVEFFEDLVAGRAVGELMFLRADGSAWGTNHQVKPLAAACAAAKIDPPISMHVLRHTYGSWLAQKGTALQVIAEAMGHADTRITHRHYAHLSPSYAAQVIRANLPALGISSTSNVTAIAKKGREPRRREVRKK